MSIFINAVFYSYRDIQVLDDISLSIQTGESVGVTGPSGGGKSTLLKLVSGLYDIQGGEITVAGAKCSEGRRKNVAMVMQNAALFAASVRDNITCGHDMDEDDVLRACEAAQLTDWIASLPEGLGTFVGERGGKVSGGQAQRIAIARAIAKDAPVILLDEPTSALDNETGAAFMIALERLTKGKTVLHVSHRHEMLAGCNRIYKLEGGRIYGA